MHFRGHTPREPLCHHHCGHAGAHVTCPPSPTLPHTNSRFVVHFVIFIARTSRDCLSAAHCRMSRAEYTAQSTHTHTPIHTIACQCHGEVPSFAALLSPFPSLEGEAETASAFILTQTHTVTSGRLRPPPVCMHPFPPTPIERCYVAESTPPFSPSLLFPPPFPSLPPFHSRSDVPPLPSPLRRPPDPPEHPETTTRTLALFQTAAREGDPSGSAGVREGGGACVGMQGRARTKQE